MNKDELDSLSRETYNEFDDRANTDSPAEAELPPSIDYGSEAYKLGFERGDAGSMKGRTVADYPEYTAFGKTLAGSETEQTDIIDKYTGDLKALKADREMTIERMENARMVESVMGGLIKAFAAFYGQKRGLDMSSVDPKTGIDWNAALNMRLGALRERGEELRGEYTAKHQSLAERVAAAKAGQAGIEKRVSAENVQQMRMFEAGAKARAVKEVEAAKSTQLEIQRGQLSATEARGAETGRHNVEQEKLGWARLEQQKADKAASGGKTEMERNLLQDSKVLGALEKSATQARADTNAWPRDAAFKKELGKGGKYVEQTRLRVAKELGISLEEVPKKGDDLLKMYEQAMNKATQRNSAVINKYQEYQKLYTEKYSTLDKAAAPTQPAQAKAKVTLLPETREVNGQKQQRVKDESGRLGWINIK